METRIVTVVNGNEDDAGAASMLAQNLAAELAYTGRHILLADASNGLGSSWSRARIDARMRPRVVAIQVQAEGCSEFLERAARRFGHIVIDADAAPARLSLCALIAAQVAVVVLAEDGKDSDRIATLSAWLSEARFFNPALRVLCVVLRRDAAPAPARLRFLPASVDLLGPASMASTSFDFAAMRSGTEIPGQCSRDRQGSADAGLFTSLWREIAPQPARHISQQFFKQ